MENFSKSIAVSGSRGLIGSALVSYLESQGYTARHLGRGPVDPTSLEGVEAIVHLAGEGIANRRWSPKQKALIYNSRIGPTEALARAVAAMSNKPRVFICASAVGFYGDRGDEILTEQSPPGLGFLPDVCRAWESALAPAREAGIRTVSLRFGMVLNPSGGALAKMLTPFRLGLGGPIGNGRQYWSWISIDDAVAVIHHALKNNSLFGPVNTVSPESLTNRDFTQILARVLKRPAVFPLPRVIARLLMGEMADGLLLASVRTLPQALQISGFRFQHPSLEGALQALLKT